MKTKDESTKMLNRYAEWITNQNLLLRFLRCDSDLIFKGYEFKSTAKSFMIEVSYSSPYTPTQNTMAERRWGMVALAARAMPHTAQLKSSYWEFAMLSACYLNNRTWHHISEGVPITLVTGQIPNLSHLKIFGRPSFVHIPAGQRKKMSDTAFARILVGYPTDTYGYLVHNPKTRKVITTRHVRFDETFNGRLSEEGKTLSAAIQSTQPPAPLTYTSSDDDEPASPPTNVVPATKQHNAPMITPSPAPTPTLSNPHKPNEPAVDNLRLGNDPKLAKAATSEHTVPSKMSSPAPIDDDKSSDTPSDNTSSDHLAGPLPTLRPPRPPMTRSRSALEKPIANKLRSKPLTFLRHQHTIPT